MYGQTEATARMSYLPYMNSLKKVGSIGVAIPGGAIFLEDENGNQIEEPHVAGELVYHGRNVTYGYATCLEDLAKDDENKGILHTGDMAEMDEDGYFFIVGRKKRFLKIFGNRVSLDECEDLIEKKYSLECACTGKDDEMHIFITGKVGAEVVAEFISGKTGLNPKAFVVKHIENIPRSGSGKKAYGELE
jgi:acyl-coenzyme A synthetase/AMP-(fatty) acid ligase